MSETLTLELPSSTGMRDLLTTRACLIENVVALHCLSVRRIPGLARSGAALEMAMVRLLKFHRRCGAVMAFADLDS